MVAYHLIYVLAVACAIAVGSAVANEQCKNKLSSDPRTCCATPTKNYGPIEDCIKEKMAKKECVSDCLIDGKAFENDDIDSAMVHAAIEKYLEGEDSEWLPIYKEAVDKCIDISKAKKDDGNDHKGGKCDHKPMKLSFCVYREVFLNCPASQWTSNADCDAWKTHITNCPHARLHGKHLAAA